MIKLFDFPKYKRCGEKHLGKCEGKSILRVVEERNKMFLYLMIALWPLAIERIYKLLGEKVKEKKHITQTLVFVALLPMFTLIAFRGENMGADTKVYLDNFSYSSRISLDKMIETSRMETGYLMFIKLISTYISNDPLVYQIICATVYFIGVISFSKQLEDRDVFLFIYFMTTLGLFTFMFTGVRQCLAMSICLFSYQFVKKKNLLAFSICIFLAFMFHRSAILFAVVYLISRRRVTWYNVLLYAGVVYLSMLYLESIQLWFNEQLEYDYTIEYTNTSNIFLVIILLLTLLCLYLTHVQQKKNESLRTLLNINFITVFFWALRSMTRVAERPSFYFLFMSCALFATSLNSVKIGKQRVFLKVVVVLLALALFLYRMRTNFSSLVPYQFY